MKPEIHVEEKDNYTLVTLKGDIRHENVRHITDTLEAMMSHHQAILLKCSEVKYLCSQALASVAKLYKQISSRGLNVKIIDPSHEVKQLLRITRLDTMIRSYSTVEAALKKDSFSPPSPDTRI